LAVAHRFTEGFKLCVVWVKLCDHERAHEFGFAPWSFALFFAATFAPWTASAVAVRTWTTTFAAGTWAARVTIFARAATTTATTAGLNTLGWT
jgi:hypothetical protein